MPPVAALVERRASIVALRRAIPRGQWPLVVARSPAHLDRLLHRAVVDAIILGPDPARGPVLDAVRHEYRAIPTLLLLPLRSDDAELLQRAHRASVAGVVVEGIDEPLVPRWLADLSLTARRRSELLPLMQPLDLVDPLQQQVWRYLVDHSTRRITTAELARTFDRARETVSRQFAAGMAPPLKRAIDAIRLYTAGQLLANLGYQVTDAARLLQFSSIALLQQTARGLFGVSARGLAGIDGSTVLRALM